MASSEGPQTAPSVKDGQDVARPRVLPTNQLVILRENELDCDLPTAIQRVRDDDKTRHSRILIVGPDDEAKARIEAQILPMPQLPMSVGQVARSGGQQALENSGQRFAPKLQSLTCLFDEAVHALDEVAEAVQEATKARQQNKIRVVREILSWMRATTDDLQQEVGGMLGGFAVVDVFDLLQDVRGQVESFFPNLRVNIPPAEGDSNCWGRATELAEALFLGIALTAHRIGGKGSVNATVGRADAMLSLRILGLGEPTQVHSPQEMSRFREIIVGQHGGRIVPDSMGPFGTGLVIELPTAP